MCIPFEGIPCSKMWNSLRPTWKRKYEQKKPQGDVNFAQIILQWSNENGIMQSHRHFFHLSRRQTHERIPSTSDKLILTDTRAFLSMIKWTLYTNISSISLVTLIFPLGWYVSEQSQWDFFNRFETSGNVFTCEFKIYTSLRHKVENETFRFLFKNIFATFALSQ